MNKKLVAYFSASGVTAGVAQKLAQAAKADLFEIQPQVSYTQADLNWMDKQSRSSVEMQNLSFRPAMAEADANIAAYDTIFVGFPIPIILALILHVNTNNVLKKIAQNVSYVPHFISLVVMIGILNTVLNPVSGFLGYINKAFGNLAYEDIRGSKTAFRHLYIWSGIWQGAGWSTIMYVSALSAVPDELHEAAKLDGASRLRRVWSVDLPTIMPTVAIMLIMRFGSVMSVGYQKAYLMQNDMNIDVSELISTYVYKQGIRNGNMSFGSAVGLLQSVINTVLVFVVNWVTNLLTDNEMGLF